MSSVTTLRLLGLCLVVAPIVCADGPPVRAWQDSLTIPTYPEGPAEQLPQFAAWAPDSANYPYPLRTNFGKQRHDDRTWRVLHLENEYLDCRILPDLGGHLYSCRDKRNGREMFYANPVIKPGEVGLRGSWVALGIESNFPVGHTRVTTSPVDFALRSESDGSARAVVEAVDRVTGMQWRVEFILRPGSTALEQRVQLYNGRAVRWPYYWWANAGVAFDDPKLRLVMPAKVVSTHATPHEIIPWPVQIGGKDGTLVANHKDEGAWFAYGSREPFFAVYKPASRSGLAHFADPNDVPGKKMWLWGSQDSWVEKELTDNFPSYVEMQGGVFQNQDIFQFLQPEQIKSFSEYWIPVYDLGGVTRVTRDALLDLERRQDSSKALALELSVTRAIPGAAVRFLIGGKVVFEMHADLTPGTTYKHLLVQPSESAYTVELADSRGAILLRHIENQYDALPPSEAPLGKVPDPDWAAGGDSEHVYLSRGNDNELRQQWIFAFSDYSAGLQSYPSSIPLKKAAGRLDLNLNRFEEAAALLQSVVAASPSDDEALFYLGVAQAMAGRDAQAREILSRLRPDSSWRSAAAAQLVEISARAKNDAAALALLKPLLAESNPPSRLGAVEVALLRRSGKSDQAKQQLARWQNLDPASPLLRAESILLGTPDEAMWSYLAPDEERVLNLVDQYLGLGMPADALVFLDHPYPTVSAADAEPGAVLSRVSPLLDYYRASCRILLGKSPASDLEHARGIYSPYLFPNRASSLAVLATALKVNPSDGLAHMLTARLFLNDLMIDQAIAEWQKALEFAPELAEARYDLVKTLTEVKKDPAAAYAVIKKGLAADPNDAELRTLSQHAAESIAAPVPAPTPSAPSSKSSPADLAATALIRAASGDAAAAASLFDPAIFTAEKQPVEVRRDYIEVQLQKIAGMARAGQCPAALDILFRLGNEDPGLAFTMYGFDAFMKTAHFQYFAADIESTCGDQKEARKRWAKVSKLSGPLSSPEFAFPILAAAKLNPDEGKSRIAAGLEQVRAALSKADAASKSGLMYLEGTLLSASGKQEDGLRELQELARSSADPWIKYLALVELRGAMNR
jgi:hypothetical protein